MVTPRSRHDPATVAGHYDELDDFYRSIWGEHVHHGVWRSGMESPEEATHALVRLVADHAGVVSGSAVCDVGCGYGGTSRALAADPGAAVTALTVSSAQYEYARSRGGGVTVLLRSWLDNELPAGSFDAVVAIESLSHMDDKARVFQECARVLKPGGRLVVCDWLTRDDPGRVERRLLLEPICHESRLPSMASASEYRALMGESGLEVDSFEDLSRAVRRTWGIVARRLARRLATDPPARRFLLSSTNPDRAFALSLARIPLAYTTGAMRYGVFAARLTGTS